MTEFTDPIEHPITKKPLTPMELGQLHAWAMQVNGALDRAIGLIEIGFEVGDAEALEDVQYEFDNVVWLIDEESWAAFDSKPTIHGFL